MTNYADLIEQANVLQARCRTIIPYSQVPAHELLTAVSLCTGLAEALLTVGNQNRNLRADLELTKRDYEANLEELLKATNAIEALQETIYVEVNGLRYIVDPRLKNPVVGVYDPELAEVLG